jgi:hypothetical protein
MRVKELIEILKTAFPDMEVVFTVDYVESEPDIICDNLGTGNRLVISLETTHNVNNN